MKKIKIHIVIQHLLKLAWYIKGVFAMNFDFYIMKKLLDVAHRKLINIIGRHGNLDQYLWMSVIP